LEPAGTDTGIVAKVLAEAIFFGRGIAIIRNMDAI
jgi:hypothetical protein